MSRGIFGNVALLLALLAVQAAWAQVAEVAPGILVTRKAYPVPLNQAPFYNFAAKTPELVQADERFVAGVLEIFPNRAEAARKVSETGWEAVSERDYEAAAKRFNQAFLLDPRGSSTYHGFAVVVAQRFKDYDYALELMNVAGRLNDPLKTLGGDRAIILMGAGRPAEAKPLLEQAIKDLPDWEVPRSYLAWALFQLGDRDGACAMARTIPSPRSLMVQANMIMLKQRASCP